MDLTLTTLFVSSTNYHSSCIKTTTHIPCNCNNQQINNKQTISCQQQDLSATEMLNVMVVQLKVLVDVMFLLKKLGIEMNPRHHHRRQV